MSGKFSLAAPPSSGKVSRREKVERSGRSSTSMTADELQAIAQGVITPKAQQHAFPTIAEHNNPVAHKASPAAASQPKATAPAPQQDFFNPQSAPAPAPATANIFDFFDPLATPAPAPAPQQQRAPQAQPKQQAVQQALDPFSQAFSSSVSFDSPGFDPFEGAPPLVVHRQSVTGPPLPPKPHAKSSPEADDLSEEDSSESDSSDDTDDSSDEDDSAKAKNKARAAKAAGQLKTGSKLPPGSASHVAETHNAPLASGSTSASSVPAGSAQPTLKVDVLAYMRKGTPFLKYGRSGYPHFRQFQLSDDNSKLVWFSGNKRAADTQIDLYTVEELRYGQTTANFARHPAPDLENSSFSLMYDHGRGSLDVIAKDPNEFRIWTKGLEELIKMANGSGRSGQLETLKTLPLDIAVHRARRSSMEIVDVRTGKTTTEMAGGVAEDQKPRAISTGNKAMHKDVAKNFTNLKYKMNKRREELRDQQYYNAPEYDNMVAILKRVGDSVARVQDAFQDGDYANADDEIWRAGVDLESLKNMMRAIKP